MLTRLERYAFAGAKTLSVLGLSGLCLLATMTLLDGLLRWLFNTSIEGVRDIGGLVIAVAVSSCLPMGLIERGHIAVRLFSRLGASWGRAVDMLASAMVLVAMVAMAWQLQSYAGKLAQARETTWVLQIPAAPFWWAVAVIVWCAVMVQAVVVASDLVHLVRGTERMAPSPPAIE